jgi:hypothetical protein
MLACNMARKKCTHDNIVKCEEANIITTIYRKTTNGKYKREASSGSGRGVTKWVCLDCVKPIDPPEKIVAY